MALTEQKLTRLIKKRGSREYYAGHSIWTQNPEDAQVFSDLLGAFQTARADGLEDCAVVVFRIGVKEFDAQFPIN